MRPGPKAAYVWRSDEFVLRKSPEEPASLFGGRGLDEELGSFASLEYETLLTWNNKNKRLIKEGGGERNSKETNNVNGMRHIKR